MHINLEFLTLLIVTGTSVCAQQNPASPQSSDRDLTQPLSGHDSDKTHLGGYTKHELGLRGFVMTGVGAAVNQANDTPHEWGQGAAGLARRFGSAFGKHIVHKAIQYPVAKLLHEELFYQRSNKQGFGPRLKAALVAVVVTRKTTTEQVTVNVAEISGAFGSGLISRLWQPASTRTISEGFESGGITLGVDAALNVIREFWPEIRHPHSHAALQSTPSLVASPPDVE
jgi:hypothetical protein